MRINKHEEIIREIIVTGRRISRDRELREILTVVLITRECLSFFSSSSVPNILVPKLFCFCGLLGIQIQGTQKDGKRDNYSVDVLCYNLEMTREHGFSFFFFSFFRDLLEV